MKKFITMFLALALVFCAVAPMTFAAEEAAIAVTVSNPTPAVGDTITVTVAFTSCPANINTFELTVDIDTAAFEVVGTAPTYGLKKNDGTTGGSSFKGNGSQAFINFVDVGEALTADSTTIMTFDVIVKGSGTIAVSDESFIVDETTQQDIAWTATAATVTAAGAAEPTVVPTTAAPTATPTVAPTTAAPTATPTVAPTAKPTVAPTAKPTAQPTVVPTAQPTTAPADPEPPKTGSTEIAVVLASVLVLAAVATCAVAFKKN